MSIGAGLTLVTGPTGGGKSCAVVSWLADIKDRPLFVMGIPELKIEHQTVPPVDEWTEMRASPEDPKLKLPYFTFPPGAIVVLDEAQRVYRPRRVGADVPPHVAAFETRRHTGVDFVLITQHPSLLDSNLRKLVTRHIHIHDTFRGRYMLEWVGMGDPDSRASRTLATRNKYSPPKKAFDLYKSSELHTKIVRKYPWYFWAVIFLVPIALVLSWYSYQRISKRVSGDDPVKVSSSQASTGVVNVSSASSSTGEKPVLTAKEYLAQYKPRIEGLLHTAPAYDEVTQPKVAPEIVGCIERKKTGDCLCYDQQGNKYPTTPAICVNYMNNGMFMAWKMPEPRQDRQKQQQQPSRSDDGPSVHILGGDQQVQQQPVVPVVRNDSTNPKYNVAMRGQ